MTAVLSLLLLGGHLLMIRPRERWMLLLFVGVAVANGGYLLLSVAEACQNLLFATVANAVGSFGSVFLIPCLFMTVRRLCDAACPQWLKWGVVGTALPLWWSS